MKKDGAAVGGGAHGVGGHGGLAGACQVGFFHDHQHVDPHTRKYGVEQFIRLYNRLKVRHIVVHL